MTAGIGDDVARLADVTDEQTAQQVLGSPTALKSSVSVRSRAYTGLCPRELLVRNDPQALVPMLDPIRLGTPASLVLPRARVAHKLRDVPAHPAATQRIAQGW